MKAIAAHAAIVLALVYAVLFAIDKVNGAMMFIENDIAKALILALAALILETVGFVVTSFIVLVLYGLLLGERNWVRLLLISAGIALALHIIFSGLLDVTLPRGTVPFLRNFALFLENLITF